MNLTIPVSYIEDRSQLVWTHTLAEVVRVERSQSGFRTSTGTTRTCEKCREGERGVRGVKPWPTATWLLTGEMFGDRREIRWALCSDHFKELRDREKEIQKQGREAWGFGSGVAPDPVVDSPWLSKDELWSGYNDPDLEPLSNPHFDTQPRA